MIVRSSELPGPTAEQHLAWWCDDRLVVPTFVYVVQASPGTPVKIGVARDVVSRIAGLQTGNPYRLRLLYVFPGAHELEWQLHQKLAEHRLEGEWFAAGPAERLFPWMRSLADAMITRYRDDGEIPSYRQPGFEWKRYRGSGANKVIVRYITPTPVDPDDAQARLAAAWMRKGGLA